MLGADVGGGRFAVADGRVYLPGAQATEARPPSGVLIQRWLASFGRRH